MIKKVEIDGVIFHVESWEEAEEVYRRFRSPGGAGGASLNGQPPPSPQAPTLPFVGAPGASEEPVPRPAARHGGRRVSITAGKQKVFSKTKADALLKFYKALKVSTHQLIFRVLAAAGSEGLDAEDLRRAASLPEDLRLSGLTMAVTRRAPVFGLEPEDILISEYRGAVSDRRIYHYTLSGEMQKVLQDMNLTSKKGG